MAGHHGAVSVAGLARYLKVSKAAAYRILATLEAQGFVTQDSGTSKYQLGLKLWRIGNAVLAQTGLETAADHILTWLVEESNESSRLGVYDHGAVIWVATHDTHRSVRVCAEVGARAPCHATATGKAMLAFRSEWLREVLARGLSRCASNTITNPQTLQAELAKVRQRGWAENVGEYSEDACAIAAPVRDRKGQVIAAVCVAVPISRWSNEIRRLIAPLVMEGGRRISAGLGYVDLRRVTTEAQRRMRHVRGSLQESGT